MASETQVVFSCDRPRCPAKGAVKKGETYPDPPRGWTYLPGRGDLMCPDCSKKFKEWWDGLPGKE